MTGNVYLNWRSILLSGALVILTACQSTSTNNLPKTTTQAQKTLNPPAYLSQTFEQQQVFNNIEHPKVDLVSQKIGKNPAVLRHLDEERKALLYYVLQEAKKRNMPAEVALLPLIESSYQPHALSPGKAGGLWQFRSKTAQNFGLKVSKSKDERFDIEASTEAALNYLDYLNDMFDGDWLLTFAAYNAGEGRVQQAIKRNAKNNRPVDYWSLQLPQTTTEYVPTLIALSNALSKSTQLRTKEDDLYQLIRYQSQKPVTLAEVAQSTGVDADLLAFYNPKVGQKEKISSLIIPAVDDKQVVSQLTFSRGEQLRFLSQTTVSVAPENPPDNVETKEVTLAKNNVDLSQQAIKSNLNLSDYTVQFLYAASNLKTHIKWPLVSAQMFIKMPFLRYHGHNLRLADF